MAIKKRETEKEKEAPKKSKKPWRIIKLCIIGLILGIFILSIEKILLSLYELLPYQITEDIIGEILFYQFYFELTAFVILAISILGLIIAIKFLRKLFWGIIKIPYYISKGIYNLSKKAKQGSEKRHVQRKRESMKAIYQNFKIVKTSLGNYKKWELGIIKAESKIGLILGARGSGKTACALKLLENVYAKTQKKCYAIGFLKEEMPSWIEVVENISEIKNNSLVIIDEGGVLFSSRRAMTNANKLMSDLLLISRHKNLSIIFISQNSANLEINAIRQADYLVLKPTSLLQKDFERKKIQEIYEGIAKDFEKYKNDKTVAYIYSDEFKGFVRNPLPSFWNVRISKSFGDSQKL